MTGLDGRVYPTPTSGDTPLETGSPAPVQAERDSAVCSVRLSAYIPSKRTKKNTYKRWIFTTVLVKVQQNLLCVVVRKLKLVIWAEFFNWYCGRGQYMMILTPAKATKPPMMSNLSGALLSLFHSHQIESTIIYS